MVHLLIMGEASTWLDAAEMQSVTGSEYYLNGHLTPKTVTIQAAAYTRGFARGMSEKVDIYEKTPVIALERTNGLWQARTPKGSVKASKVIPERQCTPSELWFHVEQADAHFPLCIHDRAMSKDEVNKLGGEPSWGIAPAYPFGSSVRKIYGVGSHRILMRNKFNYNSLMAAGERDVQKAVRNHERSFKGCFPMLKAVEMEHRWGGRHCLSWNNVPVFGELEENMFAACCQNGLGVSKGTLSGILAA